MATKDVKNVHFYQIDHKIKKIFKGAKFIILPSPKAFKEFPFLRTHFKQKPKEGYFIWVKETINYPLTTCIFIDSINIFQNLQNLIIVEKNAKVRISSICKAMRKNLGGKHQATSKVILKEKASLSMQHFHNWGPKSTVNSDLAFSLEKGAKLSYSYRCLEIPGELQTKTSSYLQSNTSANLVFTILAKEGKVKMNDSIFFNGENAKAITRIRTIADQGGKIFSRNKMVANSKGTGHLDCMGLLLDKDSTIQLIPELVNRNKNASLTHEASVGNISEEVLSYLRSRGLNKNEAIDLIVSGFLSEERPIAIKGHLVQPEFYM